MKAHLQKGFTLIKLMIVVAIIGIAAVAIVEYGEYTIRPIRAKVIEGLVLASGAKTSVAKYFSSNGKLPLDNTAAGMAMAASISGNSVQTVTVKSGVIEVLFSAATIKGSTLQLEPITTGGKVVWNCKKGNLEGKYRPSSCR